jgi:hypothetical protein
MSTLEKLAVCYMCTVRTRCAAIPSRQFTDVTSKHHEWCLAASVFDVARSEYATAT